MKKEIKKKKEATPATPATPAKTTVIISELDELIKVHQFLKDHHFNSIGDLEVRISRLV